MPDYSGNVLRLCIYGSSRGKAVGMRLYGFPSGFHVNSDSLMTFLQRRAPGKNPWSSPRNEPDIPVFLSGIDGNVTNGEPICAEIQNCDSRPGPSRTVPRPGHADYPAFVKYGAIPDGGGAFSGRMTAPVCIAGGLCLQYLQTLGIRVISHVLSIGGIYDSPFDPMNPLPVENTVFPVLNEAAASEMIHSILSISGKGDSVGGEIECAVTGLRAGIGGPLFDGLESRLSTLLFSVPAVKGIMFGENPAASTGTAYNDGFCISDGTVRTRTNRHGGILGGMSSGMPLLFRVSVKPTPTIISEQDSVDLRSYEPVRISGSGRNDPCIVPRAVPVIEAVTAIGILDALLEEKREFDRTAKRD